MSVYRVARATVLSGCKLVFRVRVRHRERVPRRGIYIVAPTHRSILDVPFAAFVTRRRLRFLAKQELFASRLGRWLFGALGAVRVARDSTDRAALRGLQEALVDGEPIAIFPEGTRRSGAKVGDLYDGAAYVALKLGVLIVPVGIGGSEEILPRGSKVPRPRRVAVVVGEPIDPGPAASGVVRRSDVGVLTTRLQASMQACFDEARTLAGAP